MTHSSASSHAAATTHTVDMQQIAELNDRLSEQRREQVTADDLGLAESPCSWPTASHLPGAAVLHRVSWDGSPEYPYVHGHFTSGTSRSEDTQDTNVVDLHTQALRELSHRLGARHVWGLGSAESS